MPAKRSALGARKRIAALAKRRRFWVSHLRSTGHDDVMANKCEGSQDEILELRFIGNSIAAEPE